MRSIVFLFAMMPFLLMSCGIANNKSMTEQKPSSTEALSNNFWVLETLNNEQITHPKDPREIGFKINTEENRISGFAGCNNFFGSFTSKESGKIEFSQMGATKMACLQSSFDEQLFLNVFDQVDGYAILGEKLELKNGSKVVATFTKSIQKKNSDVVGKYWKLKTLNDKKVVMTENKEREVHFILKDHNNTISGYDGCNTFSGEFEMNDDNRFTASRMKSTLRICPDSDFDENKFISLFIGPVAYEVNGDQLTLTQKDKDVKATFEAVYFN